MLHASRASMQNASSESSNIQVSKVAPGLMQDILRYYRITDHRSSSLAATYGRLQECNCGTCSKPRLSTHDVFSTHPKTELSNIAEASKASWGWPGHSCFCWEAEGRDLHWPVNWPKCPLVIQGSSKWSTWVLFVAIATTATTPGRSGPPGPDSSSETWMVKCFMLPKAIELLKWKSVIASNLPKLEDERFQQSFLSPPTPACTWGGYNLLHNIIIHLYNFANSMVWHWEPARLRWFYRVIIPFQAPQRACRKDGAFDGMAFRKSSRAWPVQRNNLCLELQRICWLLVTLSDC